MRQHAKKIDGRPTGSYWWESMSEFTSAFDREMRKRYSLPEHYVSQSWTGETWADVRRKSMAGDSTHVRDAENLLEDIVLSVETPVLEWTNSIAGPVPDVASAVAGAPESMWVQVEAESEHAPVRIVVDITSSGGIGHEQLTRRGIACLALTMVVSRQRPVELLVVSALGSGPKTGANIIRVGTTPLDTSLACYALTSQGLCRGVGYGWLQRVLGTNGAWAWDIHPVRPSARARYAKNLGELVDEEGTVSLIIPPIHLHDPLLTDPVGFIRRTVAALNGEPESIERGE